MPNPTFRPQRSVQRLLASGLLAATAACGGPSQALTDLLHDPAITPYATTCREWATSQEKDLSGGAYNPAVLFVQTWPESSTGSDLFLPESRLVAALEQGEVRRLHVVARGGLGKSRLAESVRAQICDALPVFLIDLKDVAKSLKGAPLGGMAPAPSGGTATAPAGAAPGDTLLRLIEKDLGIQDKPDARSKLAEAFAAQRALLFLDAIEEVDLIARPGVMGQVLGLGERFPLLQLALMSRPPVLDDNYGFGAVDARLEIPPLDCKVTDAFIARSHKTDDDRRRFAAFLTRNGLDEKAHFGLQCIYPYLATYRDIQTLSAFEMQTRKGDPGFLTSRATVYEALASARLKKEFDNLGWTVAEALDMVDRLVRVQTADGGQRNFTFGLDACFKAIDARWGETAVDAGVGGNLEQRRKHVCEKTFQSALFVRTEGSQAFTFSDRATTDLFLARWLAGEISRGKDDCTLVAKHADLLGNPGITRFFVGQPAGQRCLGHAIDALCKKSDKPGANVAVLDEGLPIGAARVQPLKDARATASSMAQKACVTAVLDDLDKTVATTP